MEKARQKKGEGSRPLAVVISLLAGLESSSFPEGCPCTHLDSHGRGLSDPGLCHSVSAGPFNNAVEAPQKILSYSSEVQDLLLYVGLEVDSFLPGYIQPPNSGFVQGTQGGGTKHIACAPDQSLGPGY